MTTVRTRAAVGHISFSAEYLLAQGEQFLNSGIDYPLSMRSGDEVLIYACPDCEAAREKWMHESASK